MIRDPQNLLSAVEAAYARHEGTWLFTVAISGIDASGKGYTAKWLQEKLEISGYRVANINIDPWQNPLPVRLRPGNAAENLYRNIFRWEDFFNQLIIPFRARKSICLDATLIRTEADIYYPYTYHFEQADILLVEGILLFQKQYFPHYDLKIWIECSFETGLQRALARNAEQLDAQQLVQDYDQYYYAAQRLHFRKDDPLHAADIVFLNDPLLT